STAAALGIDPLDPTQAVDGAARILAGNLRSFDSLPLALAAYNAGGGAVRKYNGIPPYPETRAYVPKVQAAIAELATGGFSGAGRRPGRDAGRGGGHGDNHATRPQCGRRRWQRSEVRRLGPTRGLCRGPGDRRAPAALDRCRAARDGFGRDSPSSRQSS